MFCSLLCRPAHCVPVHRPVCGLLHTHGYRQHFRQRSTGALRPLRWACSPAAEPLLPPHVAAAIVIGHVELLAPMKITIKV